MSATNFFSRSLLSLTFVFFALVARAELEISLSPSKTNGVYQLGETIIWQVKVSGDDSTAIHQANYVLKQGGATVIGRGTLAFTNGTCSIQTSLSEPGTILATVTATNTSQQVIKALGGAAVAPEKIPPSSPCPADFDAFWQAKLDELSAVPENPELEKGVSGVTNVEYWKITLNNIRGTHIQGQLARPEPGGKLPAMLIVQYAGVYPLQKQWVTERAAQGWLVLNIMAHDLPIDESAAFYQAQATNELNNYAAIGRDDRDRSYFVRMFTGCYRAAEYLSERPDWDGKTLVVTGTSQGGIQSFATAALNPKITALLTLVPAGCDNTGDLAGRQPGWPGWLIGVSAAGKEKVRQTSRYFDAVNFAARVKCPSLVGLGLIDTTSPASGVFAAFNQLRGPKEIVVMPHAEHKNRNGSQALYSKRFDAWNKALVKGKTVPPE